MTTDKPFVIRRTRTKQFRVYLYDTDGNVLAHSEAYQRKAGAKRCIYRTLYLDYVDTPYSTTLRLVKDNDSDNNPTFHLRVVGRNNEIVMHSPSVRQIKVGQLAAKIMAIVGSYDPDTMNGTEFYHDDSYIRKPKAQ